MNIILLLHKKNISETVSNTQKISKSLIKNILLNLYMPNKEY